MFLKSTILLAVAYKFLFIKMDIKRVAIKVSLGLGKWKVSNLSGMVGYNDFFWDPTMYDELNLNDTIIWHVRRKSIGVICYAHSSSK